MIDTLLAIFIFGLGCLWVWFRVSLQKSERTYSIFYLLLWIYHFAFAWYFYRYINEVGGDSIHYWYETAALSGMGVIWMNVFGIGNYFLTWFNFLLAVMLGMSYLIGFLTYALISFIGISLIFEKSTKLFREINFQRLGVVLCFGSCLLPGLHFWTGGVSKEALLILSVGIIFYFIDSPKKRAIFYLGFGVLLAFLVRPITGIVLIIPVFWNLFIYSKAQKWLKFAIMISGIALVIFALNHLKLITHMPAWTWEAFQQFSAQQFEFLESLNPASSVEMSTMNFLERSWVVFFEPLPWDAWDLNSLVFSIENLMLLILLVLALYVRVRYKVKLPHALQLILVPVVLMYFVFTFTLNNFGVIYRMKAIYHPFLYISGLWLIFKAISELTIKKKTA